MKFSDLTMNDIVELANGNLDDAQLATRLARRMALEVKKACLGEAFPTVDQEVLDVTAEVTDRDLRARMAARIAAADAASGGLASALLNAEELPEFP